MRRVRLSRTKKKKRREEEKKKKHKVKKKKKKNDKRKAKKGGRGRWGENQAAREPDRSQSESEESPSCMHGVPAV